MKDCSGGCWKGGGVSEPRPIWIAGYQPTGKAPDELHPPSGGSGVQHPLTIDGEPLSTKQLHELITSQALTIDKLYSEVGRLNDVIGLLRNWVKAYPLDMFPEPDLKLARKLLEDGGVNYSALNVYSMRHVINGVGKIIDEALGEVNE